MTPSTPAIPHSTVPAGSTAAWKDKKRYLWLIGLVVPSLAFIGYGAWELTGSDAQTVVLGSTPGGEELGGPVDLTALQTWVGTGNVLPSTGYTIYFSGLTGNNTIKLWLLG